MGKFGQAAILATECVASKGLAPREAWDFGIAQLSASASSQVKSCPRNAYLGLCEAGVVVGIKAGPYGAPNNKNGQYALNAYRILKSNPNRPPANTALWTQATAPDVLVENQQIDVVVSLWKRALLH